MSENNPLNDFLEMEENGSESFADLPFDFPSPKTVVQNSPAQPPAPAVQPVTQASVMQTPQQTAQPMQPPVQNAAPAPAAPQASLFEAAVAQTPILETLDGIYGYREKSLKRNGICLL